MFKHPWAAQRALMDRVLYDFFRGGGALAWRMVALSFIYTSVATTLTAVRDSVNVLDHSLAGAVMGGVWRTPVGPRATVMGIAVGCILGTTSGCCFKAQEWLRGTTAADHWNEELQYMKNKALIEDKRRKEKAKEIDKFAAWYAEPDEFVNKEKGQETIVERLQKFFLS